MLVDMGYEREDAVYALRVTSNNLEHACQYLMTNPRPSQQQQSMPSGLSSRLQELQQRVELINRQRQLISE